ncbi:MAG: tetratricopeptide repeat protein [Azoarcus sp.]|nr:tetratricopeptide repeat protein [Azoarcus sp.]
MASVNTYDNKKFLIVDDLPEMRSSLRTQLASLGYSNVAISSNVRTALDHLEQGSFDVILCDYYLGGGTDGQQVLEHVRNRKLISRSTLFIMITAEKGYASVVTAAECQPDDYLLKPFTADTLQARLTRLLDKKTRLAKVDAMQEKERWPEVVAACDEIIASGDRYQPDAMRIRGNALIACGRIDEAMAFYNQVLGIRAMPWARFGLARAQYAQGDADNCKATLTQLILEAPQLLSAYDLLGRVHVDTGQADEALKILDQACTIAPDSLSRHRAIAKVAEEMSDFTRVESALARVVKKTHNSPLRDTADIARLGNAYSEMGEPAKAIELIDDARKNFKSDANDPQLAAVEALAQHKAGKPELAAAALARALTSEPGTLPKDVAMSIARACLATGRQAEGEAMLKSVVQNNPDSAAVHEQVAAALNVHGSPERAATLIQECREEVVALNNEAVRRGRAGELGEAATMLTEAAERLPGNAQIVSNAAFALLLDIYSNGPDASKLRDALRFQETVTALNPRHPKLTDIADLQRRIRAKYGQTS